MGLRRACIGLCLLPAMLMTVPPAPGAARTVTPLGLGSCATTLGVYQCSGLVRTWDGVPLDATVTLPSSTAGVGLPLVVELNGLGNSKYEYLDPGSPAYTDNAYGWAKRGYAVLTYTARGFWGSCGTPEARAASANGCARGYIHLADTRYEVRDAQELIGDLVDDGTVDPRRIGVTGDSYGGGQSFSLAALADRVMLPDGRLTPWRSHRGTPLRLAAAAPVIPWTDLVYAIAPNGRSRSDALTPTAALTTPVGVFKASIANAIFAATQTAVGPGQPIGEPFVAGRPMGYLAPAGVDAEADVARWVARADAGEPYDDAYIQDVIRQLERFHSAYGIDSSSAPPPLLVGSGFTDDIFPVDETLRYAYRLGREHPATPVSLLLGDFGHQRAANKTPDRQRLVREIHAWFDRYVRGDGPTPAQGVTATTQTCPRDAPSGGPFTAPDFNALAPGRVLLSTDQPQTLSSSGGDPSTAAAIDPAAGGGDGCAQTSAAKAPGTAAYSLPPARGAGFTLLGAPEVDAGLQVSGDPATTQIAARLWDVAPDGATQTLVARGLYRPSGGADDRWQLHPSAWRFQAGHIPKLELLGSDAPYGRPSNASFQITVKRLTLRLPVHEPAGATGRPVRFAPRCRSRRRFLITLRRDLRSARVTVAGRRVGVRRLRGRWRALIDLRGLPAGVVLVRMTGRSTAGRRVRALRRYRTCARR